MTYRRGDYEVRDGTCLSIAHLPSNTYRVALCSDCDGGGLTWIDGDDAVALALVGMRDDGVEPTISLLAFDLELGTAHAITFASGEDELAGWYMQDDVPVHVRGGVVEVPSVRGTERVALADLLRAMRSTHPEAESADSSPAEEAAPPEETSEALPTAAPATDPPAPAEPAPTPTPASAPEASSRGCAGCAVTRHEPVRPLGLIALALLAAWSRSRRSRLGGR